MLYPAPSTAAGEHGFSDRYLYIGGSGNASGPDGGVINYV